MRLAELHAIKVGALQDFPQEMFFAAGHVFKQFLQIVDTGQNLLIFHFMVSLSMLIFGHRCQKHQPTGRRSKATEQGIKCCGFTVSTVS